ncbi:hypothetical protein RvY_16464-2 [Ramazzottius varieornatus]|nr:hypothetical protein RvY_16464-2 [Ramazzottius varieornatus]
MYRMMSAVDICLFHIADHNEENQLLEDSIKVLDIAFRVLKETKTPKTFVLVSTTMTWAETKFFSKYAVKPELFPMDPQLVDKETEAILEFETTKTEQEMNIEAFGFYEDEFRRRKAHPSFRQHLEFERQFMTLNDKAEAASVAYVVAAGIIYGYGENLFHWLFKEAWSNGQDVSLLNDGSVHIPTIHARDLCQVILNVCLEPPRNKYLIAVDEGRPTLRDITEATSQALSEGGVKETSADELLMEKTINRVEYDTLTSDVRMEPTTVADMKSRWLARNGFVQSVSRLIEEYKILRNLHPLRIAIYGPPFSGKTTLARALAKDYRLPLIDVKELTETGVASLEVAVKQREDGSDGDVVAKAAEAQQVLDGITMSRAQNMGRIGDHYVMRFVKEMLDTVQCKNKGFVLDGYPESYSSAKELFEVKHGSSNETEKMEAVTSTVDHFLVPEIVFALEAPEEFLRNRMLGKPIPQSKGEPPIEVQVVQRFAEYNVIMADAEDSVLTYFDELEVPWTPIDVTRDSSDTMEHSRQTAVKRVGRPRNYPLSKPEKLQLYRGEAERRILQADAVALQQKFRTNLEDMERDRRKKQWQEDLDRIAKASQVASKSLPIPTRQYLMTFVFPLLTDALTACEAARPSDPLDFLAEYLLQNSKPLYLERRVPFKEMTAQARRKYQRKTSPREKKDGDLSGNDIHSR